MEYDFNDFTKWLGRQDPNTKYDWHSCAECAVGSFLIDQGVSKDDVHGMLSKFSEIFDNVEAIDPSKVSINDRKSSRDRYHYITHDLLQRADVSDVDDTKAGGRIPDGVTCLKIDSTHQSWTWP